MDSISYLGRRGGLGLTMLLNLTNHVETLDFFFTNSFRSSLRLEHLAEDSTAKQANIA